MRVICKRTASIVPRITVSCAKSVTQFSEVVICRRFRPAGGQPLFRVFLRLPDHNPLKRLEAFFRVISLGSEEGVRLIRRGPASFYPTRCKTPSAALVSSVLAAPEIVLRARGVLGLARNTTPDEDYAKEGLIHPFLFSSP